jgi:hypothetical protein
MYVIDAATASSFEDAKSALGKLIPFSFSYEHWFIADALPILVSMKRSHCKEPNLNFLLQRRLFAMSI